MCLASRFLCVPSVAGGAAGTARVADFLSSVDFMSFPMKKGENTRPMDFEKWMSQ
jgi:hypothetical protein